MRRRSIDLTCLLLLAGVLACNLGTILPAPVITTTTTTAVTPTLTATSIPTIPTSTSTIEDTEPTLQAPSTEDSPLVPPAGWAVFSSDALGFSVWHLEGALVIEGDDSVNFLYQEGIVVVKRLLLMPGQTIQDVAETFVSQLEEPLRSMTVPSAEPLNIAGHEAYFWEIAKSLLLARLENNNIGLVYIGFDYTDPDFLQDVMIPFALQTLGSFRLLGP